jgi:hypothetical protein
MVCCLLFAVHKMTQTTKMFDKKWMGQHIWCQVFIVITTYDVAKEPSHLAFLPRQKYVVCCYSVSWLWPTTQDHYATNRHLVRNAKQTNVGLWVHSIYTYTKSKIHFRKQFEKFKLLSLGRSSYKRSKSVWSTHIHTYMHVMCFGDHCDHTRMQKRLSLIFKFLFLLSNCTMTWSINFSAKCLSKIEIFDVIIAKIEWVLYKN